VKTGTYGLEEPAVLSLRFLPGLVNNRSLCSKVVRKHRDAIMLRSSTSERNVMGRNDTVCSIG
jgi:hypothetical protein